MAELRTVEVRVRPRLDAVTVRPGDKLVVRVRSGFTLAERDEWLAHLHDALPGVEPVFIAAEQILVYRPDGAGDD